MCATFVVSNFQVKPFSMTTIVMSTHKLNPLAIDKSLRSKKKLRYHITSTHAEKEAFQCDIKSVGIQCTYNSTTNSNLRAHKKRVHEEKPANTKLAKHVCALCGYTTAKKFNLDKHGESCGKTLEPNSIDHSCKLCHKTFATKKSLNRHSKLHNSKK